MRAVSSSTDAPPQLLPERPNSTVPITEAALALARLAAELRRLPPKLTPGGVRGRRGAPPKGWRALARPPAALAPRPEELPRFMALRGEGHGVVCAEGCVEWHGDSSRTGPGGE